MKRLQPYFALSLCALLFLSVAPIASTQNSLKEMKLLGYITEFHSPNSFEIEDYRITRDESVVLEFENQSPEVSFKMDDLRVGTLVEIRGLYNETANALKATQMKVDLEQFRQLDVMTILDRTPSQLQQTESGWRGIIVADGRRIQIEPTTELLFKANKSEKKNEKYERKKEEAKTRRPNKDDWTKMSKGNSDDSWATGDPYRSNTVALKSLAEIGPGTTMEYHGREQSDGTVLATKIEFWRNELEKGEASLWKEIKIKEEPFNFESGKPGELKIGSDKYKVLPNEEVQQYVNLIGQSLIPAYIKRLPESQRIPFQFRVIKEKGFNAQAYPNGMIVINSDVFDVLENEAQLAAVIGHEIAHATQEHSYRKLQHNKKRRTALVIGSLVAQGFGYYGVSDILNIVRIAMVQGYGRTLENQADRIGLQYMTDAGYDPREAPRVWKLAAKKHGDAPTFYWSSHDSPSERRSFLMVTIRNGFSDSDFATLKKNEEKFQHIARLVKEASEKKRKIKVV